MKVLVCGGRNYACEIDTSARHPVCLIDVVEAKIIGDTLTEFKRLNPSFDTLIEGCAPGADVTCGLWAAFNDVLLYQMPAEWKKYDLRAGPKRNALMLSQHEPDVLIAFPGGYGTTDMCNKARRRGVKVLGYVGEVELAQCPVER